jgi:hypothetical protein
LSGVALLALPSALIDKIKFSDPSIWLKICQKLPELGSELDGLEHLVDRFVGQYLPSLFRARAETEIDRVGLDFGITLWQPAPVASRAADLLITEFQRALSEPG